MKYVKKAKPSLACIRHSAAHVMAQAVQDLFRNEGPVLFGGGPPIDDGFYYDFQLPRPLQPSDLEWIERRMREIIQQSPFFQKKSLSPQEAQEVFQNQPFKLEIIEGLLSGRMDADGNQVEAAIQELSIYQHADFMDLCAGPHVDNASQIPIDGFQLARIAGAYWRGDNKNPMLQRIYAYCFDSKQELDKHLKRLNEAKLRDHRKIGRELELFFFSPEAPGMPYWLPNGLIIYQELIQFWRKEHRKRQYQEISSPMMHHQKIWEQSGHWQHYREEMFLMDEKKGQGGQLGLKPMNCPDAMVVFNHKKRSYKELPLRLSDCDVLHRNELSGALHGLFRVRNFSQDDAHIFLQLHQVESEIAAILDIVDHFYSIFQLKYHFRLGLRPAKFIGSKDKWDRAEKILEEILAKKVGAEKFSIEAGEGAFYGPKIDILIEDAIGREWQMGSIQLDFHLPNRFACKFVNNQGNAEIPIVIHRVIYGSMERFIGILIEHYAGDLPIWLSPVQIAILPIADKHMEKCRQLDEKCMLNDFRSKLMHPDESLSARIRKAKLQRIPLIAVIGDQELCHQKIAVRKRGQKQPMQMKEDDFLENMRKWVEEKG